MTLKGSTSSYLGSFEQQTGKKLCAGLIYGTPAEGISPYRSVFTDAATNGTYVQYALQPVDLQDLTSITSDDARYISIAKDIEAQQCKDPREIYRASFFCGNTA